MSNHYIFPIGGIDYLRTFQEFDEWFSTEEACVDYLKRLRWSDGFICPTCQGRKSWHTETRKLGACCSIAFYSNLLLIFPVTYKELVGGKEPGTGPWDERQ